MVEKCVDDAEEKVNIAEMEVGGNHFKKMLKSVPKFLGVSVSCLRKICKLGSSSAFLILCNRD